jgi:hypothetical protein
MPFGHFSIWVAYTIAMLLSVQKAMVRDHTASKFSATAFFCSTTRAEMAAHAPSSASSSFSSQRTPSMQPSLYGCIGLVPGPPQLERFPLAVPLGKVLHCLAHHLHFTLFSCWFQVWLCTWFLVFSFLTTSLLLLYSSGLPRLLRSMLEGSEDGSYLLWYNS